MTPKEIGRHASRIFHGSLPVTWVVRNEETQEDYGVDCEVEVVENERATGLMFKVQQKGGHPLPRVAAGQFVTVRLNTARLGYYLNEVPLPVVLVAVDVPGNSVFWVGLQGNPVISKQYHHARQSNTRTLTIRLPVENRLPSTAPLLLNAVRRIADFLAVRKIPDLDSQRMRTVVSCHDDPAAIAEALTFHRDSLRHQQIEELISTAPERALSEAKAILASPSERVRTRFAAGLCVVQIEAATAPNDFERILRARLDVGRQLLLLVRPQAVDPDLRIFGRLYFRVALMHRYAVEAFALAVCSSQRPESTIDSLARSALVLQRYRANATAHVAFVRAYRLFVRLVEREQFHMVPKSWPMLAMALVHYVARLRLDDIEYRPLLEWIDARGAFATDVAVQLKQWDEARNCILYSLMLCNPSDESEKAARIANARTKAEDVGDSTLRAQLLQEIAEFAAGMPLASAETSFDEETTLIGLLAKSMGIDIDTGTDPVAKIVRIGLLDRNPERVLKNCRHLFFSVDGYGLPGAWLSLPTAGTKSLKCTKFGKSVSGVSLDDVYKLFAGSFCNQCTSCEAHSDGWRWSVEWQVSQNNLHGRRAQNLGPKPGAGGS